MTTPEGPDPYEAPSRRTLTVGMIAIVLAIALIVALIAMFAWRSHAQQLAADLDETESKLAEAEEEQQHALEEAYDKGYKAGKLQERIAAEAELNKTARAAMEAAWDAMDDGSRSSVCLGLELGVLDGSHLEPAADPLPGVTGNQIEAYFREKCNLSA